MCASAGPEFAGRGVERIPVQNDRAVGIRLADGTEHRASVVISASHGHATIFNMLEGRYVDNTTRGYHRGLPLFSPLLHLPYSVHRAFDDAPPSVGSVSIPLEQPVPLAGK